MRVIVMLSVLLAVCQSVFASVLMTHWHTRNGAQVDFVPTHDLPIVDVAVSFRAGSAYDGAHWGLANMVANTVDAGTTHHSELQIATQFDQLGAHYGASVDRDSATFILRSLNQPSILWQSVLQLGDVLSHATFPQAPWQRIRAQQLVGLKLASQQPEVLADWRLYQALYGKHPYAHPVDGTPKTVQTLTPTLAKQFYHQYYVAKNAVITIVGDVSNAQAHKLAALFSSVLPVGQPATALPVAMPLSQSKTIRIPFPSKQTTIMMAALGSKVSNPDMIALRLANYPLGGAGLTSLLSKLVRERHGLVYGVDSGFISYERRGVFMVMAQTRNDKAGQAVALMQQTVVHYLHQGPNAEQLNTAKDYITGAFPVSLASNAALLGVINHLSFYGLAQDYIQTYLKRVKATTLSTVHKALQHTVDWRHHVTVIVGGSE